MADCGVNFIGVLFLLLLLCSKGSSSFGKGRGRKAKPKEPPKQPWRCGPRNP